MQKIKLFFVSDDIRAYSGISIQTKKLLKGLLKTGQYEIIHGAVAMNHNKTPFKGEFINYQGIKIYNLSSTASKAGDKNVINWIINTEKPDIFICFGDPRFFSHLFMSDNEIRNKCKFVLYHVWDNDPFPTFNIPWYNSCDRVVTFSKKSFQLLQDNGVENDCIPLGYDPSEFYRLPDEEIKKEKMNFLNQVKERFSIKENHKIVLWNNKNMPRKRPLDVMKTFTDYWKKHQDAVLIMHTEPVAIEGTDLLNYFATLEDGEVPIIFSSTPLDSSRLNALYNIADITLNIAHSEGFGLCIGESLLTETPVLVNSTGGMTEQMGDEKKWGLLLEPDLRVLSGALITPFCYEDYIHPARITEGLETLLHSEDLRTLGKEGREFIIKNYHTDDVIKKWDIVLKDIIVTPSKFKKYELISI